MEHANTQTQKKARELKTRANAVGLSVNKLCRAAKVDRSAFVRWLNGTGAALFENIQACESVVAKAEAEETTGAEQSAAA